MIFLLRRLDKTIKLICTKLLKNRNSNLKESSYKTYETYGHFNPPPVEGCEQGRGAVSPEFNN